MLKDLLCTSLSQTSCLDSVLLLISKLIVDRKLIHVELCISIGQL
uniref:Uncharacterized protein n=1 Tax=Rhizophora mucronata TaxID=61149 RepID=A0A2P2R0L2_RHIMU